jgi:hypothetical protein
MNFQNLMIPVSDACLQDVPPLALLAWQVPPYTKFVCNALFLGSYDI